MCLDRSYKSDEVLKANSLLIAFVTSIKFTLLLMEGILTILTF
jgi:hypothetical protein